MTTRSPQVRTPPLPTDLGSTAARMFAANERLNQLLIEHLDPLAWRLKPSGNARPIAAIFTHMHNVRCKWVRLNAPPLDVPPLLDRAHCTPQQVSLGLAESAARCEYLLAGALGNHDGSIRYFLRDGWSRPWQASPKMLFYMLAHEAHHRGQVVMLARQFGVGLPNQLDSGALDGDISTRSR